MDKKVTTFSNDKRHYRCSPFLTIWVSASLQYPWISRVRIALKFAKNSVTSIRNILQNNELRAKLSEFYVKFTGVKRIPRFPDLLTDHHEKHADGCKFFFANVRRTEKVNFGNHVKTLSRQIEVLYNLLEQIYNDCLVKRFTHKLHPFSNVPWIVRAVLLVAELLGQTYGTTIRVLPALPQRWKNAAAFPRTHRHRSPRLPHHGQRNRTDQFRYTVLLGKTFLVVTQEL